MVFNFSKGCRYKPIHQNRMCWFCGNCSFLLLVLIVFIPTSQAMDLKAIEKQVDKYTNMYMFGVDFNRDRSKYLTVSGVSGNKLFSTTSKAQGFFSSYNNDVRLNLLTYPEFNKLSAQLISKISYFQYLPKAIAKYINFLDIRPLELTINYVVISNDNKVFKVTKWIPVSKKINLTFNGNIHADQITTVPLTKTN